MGWKQGRIPEIVLGPLPLAEDFFCLPSFEENGLLVIEPQVSATTAASVSPAMINYLHQ